MLIPKRFASILGTVLVFFAFLSPALAQESRVDVYEAGQVKSVVFIVGRAEYFVNGQVPGIKMDAKPFIKDGRTFVPIRYLAYGLGVAERDVGWNQKAKQVTLKRQGVEAKLTVGSRTMYTNGRAQQMDVAPRLEKDGRTYLPARWVAEALGYQVEWLGDDRIVACWPKGQPRPDEDIERIRQYIKPIPPGPQSGWSMRSVGGFQVYLPSPDADIIERKWSDDRYQTKNGVHIWLTPELKVVTILVPARETLERNNSLGAYDELYRILYGTFKNEKLAREVTDYVKEKKLTWDVPIPTKQWTAPDGRIIYLQDDGMNTSIDIEPPSGIPQQS